MVLGLGINFWEHPRGQVYLGIGIPSGKVCYPWILKRRNELCDPTPLHGRTPPHWTVYGLEVDLIVCLPRSMAVWFASDLHNFSPMPPAANRAMFPHLFLISGATRRQQTCISGTKNQPKEEVLGRTSLRTSGQKLRSGPPNPGKTSILARKSRADVHERTSVWKTSGWFFVP